MDNELERARDSFIKLARSLALARPWEGRKLTNASQDAHAQDSITNLVLSAFDSGYAHAEERVKELEAALRTFLEVLDVVTPEIVARFQFCDLHGMKYTGPTYEKELKTLRELLDGKAAFGAKEL